MPGSYSQSQYDGASDSDAESTSSMDVNVNKDRLLSPSRRPQPDETMDALGTKLQDSLHFSGSERAENGSDWSRSRHFPSHGVAKNGEREEDQARGAGIDR
jgi:hypothetical protein